jgi:CBS-domain-containing membrane protein
MWHEVVTIRPETLLSEATGQMLSRRINCLPVVDENGRLCGILTSTDLLQAFQRMQEQVEYESATPQPEE